MAHTVSIAQAAGTANSMERAKLALNASQTTVLRVARIQYDGDYLPLAFEKVVLPLDRFPGVVPDGGDIPDIFELSQRHGLTLGRATERVSIIPATRDVTLLWGLQRGQTQ
jgi:DNA-binding GntR family transcriptional regulator